MHNGCILDHYVVVSLPFLHRYCEAALDRNRSGSSQAGLEITAVHFAVIVTMALASERQCKRSSVADGSVGWSQRLLFLLVL